jgi:hypothetical protein
MTGQPNTACVLRNLRQIADFTGSLTWCALAGLKGSEVRTAPIN